MGIAIVLLITDRFVLHHGVNEDGAVAEHSIAVLPFVDMSSGKDQEYFSDGISEELLNLLAKIPQLQVTARTSSFAFKGKGTGIPEIARTLHVAHVLEGSVRKSGNAVRITAQLIRAGTDTHLWSQTYDRKLDDIFAIQDEIAADRSEAAQGHAARRGPKGAHDKPERMHSSCRPSSLQGRATPRRTSSVRRARNRKALAIDPRYAPSVGRAGSELQATRRARAAARQERTPNPARRPDEGSRDRSGLRAGPCPTRPDRRCTATTTRGQHSTARRALNLIRRRDRAQRLRHAAPEISAVWTRRWQVEGVVRRDPVAIRVGALPTWAIFQRSAGPVRRLDRDEPHRAEPRPRP